MFFLMGAASPPNPPPGISSPGPLNEALGLGEGTVCRSACSGLVRQEVAAHWIDWKGEGTGWVLKIVQWASAHCLGVERAEIEGRETLSFDFAQDRRSRRSLRVTPH